jgi:5-methylcytosine-specific restriction enzyme subunit McrC
MSVPVRNVYYLLSYAWDALEEAGPAATGVAPFKTLPDLLAAVLAAGVERLVKRVIDRGYVPVAEDTRTPRGKIVIGETVKRNLLHLPAVHGVSDTLDADVPHNRAVKAGLARLARCDAVDPALRARCLDLRRRLPSVADVPLTAGLLARIQLHRNTHRYRLPVEVCRLLLHALLPDPGTRRVAFRDFTRDDRLMARLFERFVRNFYRREQAAFPKVGGVRIDWAAVEGDDAALALLPEMQTDVCLESAERQLVVDCKYYSQTLGGYYDARTLHAPHLYQLFAYLRNLAVRDGQGKLLEGMLLYPTVDRELDLQYTVHGHPVRVATVDLGRDWLDIHRRLLELIQP